ncbi:MAG: serpin family protein [Gemmatimonadales bacterium]|nr:serpin family protein [Gemmatimonadales bacterium]
MNLAFCRGALGVALAGAIACSSTTESDGPPPLLTALPRSLSAGEVKLVAASNQFGFDLLREIRKTAATENVFLSPVSASMALGMALHGAAGTTFDGMRTALRLGTASEEEISAGYRTLLDLLKDLDPTSQFEIANAIWARAGFPFAETFLTAARSSFDARVEALDFSAPTALPTINGWVNDKTRGKIPTILEEIPPDAVMYLMNAIYFKGSWRAAFDRARTQPLPFQAATGGAQTVPTMDLDVADLRVGGTADYRAVELLYGNGAFAMTIVLPHQGRTLADVAATLDATSWGALVAGLHNGQAGLQLPKFRLEWKRLLNDDLAAMGMGVALSDALADFSKMLEPGAPRVFISKVLQKSFVNVDEEGTEAAAVTSVEIRETSAPEIIRIDRPFLFAIRERLSGTILFLGQINRIP